MSLRFIPGAEGEFSQAVSVVSQALSMETVNRVSADAVLSEAISVVSQALSAEASARAAADSLLNQGLSVLSNAVSAVSQAVSAVSAAVVLVSALATSALGVADGVSNALSAETINRVSADAALSQQVSAVSNSLSIETIARITGDNLLSLAISVVSQGLSVETAARVAGDNALSTLISVVSQQLSLQVSALSQVHSALSQAVSVADAALSVRIDTQSQAISVISQALSVLSGRVSGLSDSHTSLVNRVSANSGTGGGITSDMMSVAIAVETSDRISADNALSNFISALSVQLSLQVSAMSQVHSALSQAVSVISNKVSGISAIISTLRGGTTGQVLKKVTEVDFIWSWQADVTGGAGSVDVTSAKISTLSQNISVVSQALSVETAARISQTSALSTAISAVSQQLSLVASALSQQISALSVQLSLQVSALSQVHSALSANVAGISLNVSAISTALSVETANRISADNMLSAGLSAAKFLLLQNNDTSALQAGHPVIHFTSANTFFRANGVGSLSQRNVIGLVADPAGSIAVSATGAIQYAGIVSLTTAKWDAQTGGAGGLTAGVLYYLGTAGTNITNAPDSNLNRPLGIALSPTALHLNIAMQDDVMSLVLNIAANVDTVSASLATVSTNVSAISTRLSALSAKLSTDISAISQAHSALSAGHASLVSDVGRISTNASAMSTAISNLSVQLSLQVSALSQVHSALSANVATISTNVSAISTRLSALSAQVSTDISAISQAHSALSANVATISTNVSAISTRLSALSAQLSTDISAISQAHSALSQAVSVADAALSVRVDTQSQAISVISTKVSGISAIISTLRGGTTGQVLKKTTEVDFVWGWAADITGGAGSVDVTSAKLSQHSQAISVLSQQVSAISALGPIVMMQNVDSVVVSAGMPVYMDGANNFKRANASTFRFVVGLVIDAAISISATGRVQTDGLVSLTTDQWSAVGLSGGFLSGGLIPGDTYYLEADAGKLRDGQPTEPPFGRPVGIALSPTVLQLQMAAVDDSFQYLNNLVSAASASLHQDISIEAAARSVAVDQVSTAVGQLSQAHSSLSLIVINNLSIISEQISVLSDAHTSLVNRVSANSGTGGGASMTSTEISAAIAVETSDRISADDALSTLISALSAKLSTEVSALSQVISAETAARISADDAISQAISVMSQALSANRVALSARIDTQSQGISVLSQQVSVISAGLGGVQMKVVATNNVITGSAVTNISGMSVSIAAGGVYQIEAQVLYNMSALSSVGIGFGLSYPAMSGAQGTWRGEFGSVNNAQVIFNATSTLSWSPGIGQYRIANFHESGANAQTNVIVLSGVPGTSAGRVYRAVMEGLFNVATGGTLQVVAKQVQNSIVVIRGSFIRAYKIA